MTADREFRLLARDFSRLVETANRLAGVTLSRDKVDLVYARLVRRLRHLGLTSFESYCALLAQPENPEIEHFVDALTTHVTAFFREKHHFEFVEREVWPLLRGRDSVRVWSAACSTGQEAYSLAISLLDAPGLHAALEVRGTDISVPAIEEARRGVYRDEDLNPVSADQRRRYFQRGIGKQAGYRRVKPRLRSCVTFAVENLVSIPASGPRFDLIMCRNALIYFAKSDAEGICRRLSQRLAPGGCLILGHSEGGLRLPSELAQVGPTCYRLTRR